MSKEFAEEMESRRVKFIAIKRKNMVKNDKKSWYYGFLSRIRKK